MKNISKILSAIGIFAIFIALAGLIFFFTKPKNNYSFNVSSQTVIKEIRLLNRLETSSFTIEKVIDAGTTGSRIREFLYGDRILLIAHGSVIAGIDLSKFKDSDIQINGKEIKAQLPAPEILITNLDNNQTRVYDRQQGLLTKGDSNLESAARAEAEKVIKDAACQGKILDDASKNARNQMNALFKSLGFEKVEIEIPQGSC